jgi:EAL domain-containing protein (putative c-di-GMP-specific phosphodiesterase class I)
VNQSIVRAIVALARAVGAETIAEWVESAETLALLRELGVDHAQGFAIGRPEPLALP